MHHIITTKVICSKCGSTSNESFFRGMGVSGIRCLTCGHTKYKENPLNQSMSSHSWQSMTNPPDQTF